MRTWLRRLFRRSPKHTIRRRHRPPEDHQTPAQRWLLGEDYRNDDKDES